MESMICANVFQQVWNWLQANATAVFSGGTLITVLAVALYVIKIIKSLRKNKNEQAATKKDVEDIEKRLTGIEDGVLLVAEKVKKQGDTLAEVEMYTQATVEVQQIDINSRKNLSDETRKNANNVILNAKHFSKNEERRKIAESQKQIAETAAKAAADIAKVAAETEKTVTPEENLYNVNFGG